MTASADELNVLDTAIAGTIVNSKAVIYGAAGEVNATTLKLGGLAVTASAAELNILAGMTTAAALKGDQGIQGIQGIQGPNGSQGPQGPAGNFSGGPLTATTGTFSDVLTAKNITLTASVGISGNITANSTAVNSGNITLTATGSTNYNSGCISTSGSASNSGCITATGSASNSGCITATGNVANAGCISTNGSVANSGNIYTNNYGNIYTNNGNITANGDGVGASGVITAARFYNSKYNGYQIGYNTIMSISSRSISSETITIPSINDTTTFGMYLCVLNIKINTTSLGSPNCITYTVLNNRSSIVILQTGTLYSQLVYYITTSNAGSGHTINCSTTTTGTGNHEIQASFIKIA